MAVKAVVDAFEAKLMEGFSAAPILGITGDDAPENASEFVTLQFPVADNKQMPLGRKYQESGACRIVISAARGRREDLAKAMTWADQIAALFRTQRFGGVKSWTPVSSRLDDDADDGNYYVLSVIVPYTFTYNG